MYYSVYLAGSGWAVKDGVLDANAKTQLFETTESGKLASLYIGHRLEADLPEANTYDEAPLREEVISSADRTYTVVVNTLRLWKTWTFSTAAAEDTIDEWEKRRRYVYDDGAPKGDWDGTSDPVHTLTIGAGHALTRDEAREWYDKYPPSGPGMTDAEIDEQFASDVENRADTAGLNNAINVPLYQREFDALVDIRFNAGSGSTGFTGGFSNTGTHSKISSSSITSFLNAGRYTEAGNRILTTANSIKGKWSKGVQNRRNFQRGMFFDEAWQRE
jgi:GH24 family phage-related lysozyme (muramidase)